MSTGLGEKYIELRPTETGRINLHFKPNGTYMGYTYMEVDGEYVYSPDAGGGVWSWYILIAIGEKLKELNDRQQYGVNLQ